MLRSLRTGGLLLAGLAASLHAQGETEKPARAVRLVKARPVPEQSQEELIAKRDEKLGKEVFEKADWLFDYDEARKQAKAQGKLILVYFTRSYAH